MKKAILYDLNYYEKSQANMQEQKLEVTTDEPRLFFRGR